MLAGGKRHRRLRVTNLRRGAQRHCVDRRAVAQQFVERRRVRHAGKRGIAAGDGNQLHAVSRSDRRHMLVACDLAEADDGDAERVHDCSPGSAVDDVAGAAPDDADVPS
jgi:hypothetical protein